MKVFVLLIAFFSTSVMAQSDGGIGSSSLPTVQQHQPPVDSIKHERGHIEVGQDGVISKIEREIQFELDRNCNTAYDIGQSLKIEILKYLNVKVHYHKFASHLQDKAIRTDLKKLANDEEIKVGSDDSTGCPDCKANKIKRLGNQLVQLHLDYADCENPPLSKDEIEAIKSFFPDISWEKVKKKDE